MRGGFGASKLFLAPIVIWRRAFCRLQSLPSQDFSLRRSNNRPNRKRTTKWVTEQGPHGHFVLETTLFVHCGPLCALDASAVAELKTRTNRWSRSNKQVPWPLRRKTANLRCQLSENRSCNQGAEDHKLIERPHFVQCSSCVPFTEHRHVSFAPASRPPLIITSCQIHEDKRT